jgi:hypothetical protein
MTEQVLDPIHWAGFTANDIDVEIQHQLGALADMGEQRSWGVAKFTEIIDRQAKGAGKYISRKDLYAAVAQHARSSGESVRMWHSTYLKVPDEIRIEYVDRLSFHQFKAIVPHAKTPDEWADVINRWLDYAANSNHNPGSVDGLRAWLGDQTNAPPPEVGRHQRIGKSVRYMLEDPKVPEQIQRFYRQMFEKNNNVCSIHALDAFMWDGVMPTDGEEV